MEKGKLALKQEHRPERSIFDSTSAILSMFLANTDLGMKLFQLNYLKVDRVGLGDLLHSICRFLQVVVD